MKAWHVTADHVQAWDDRQLSAAEKSGEARVVELGAEIGGILIDGRLAAIISATNHEKTILLVCPDSDNAPELLAQLLDGGVAKEVNLSGFGPHAIWVDRDALKEAMMPFRSDLLVGETHRTVTSRWGVAVYKGEDAFEIRIPTGSNKAEIGAIYLPEESPVIQALRKVPIRL